MGSTNAGVVGRLPNEEQSTTPLKYGLDAMFAPGSVAVIGATDRPGTVGRTVLENLLHGRYKGKVYAVNPKREELLGVKAYKTVRDIPQPVDLVVVATPAAAVPQLIGECVDAGARSAVVVSAGFKERGEEGAALEQKIKDQLRRGSMRLIGPNCLGIMNPAIGLNATFAKDAPRAGNVAFLSQSGALLSAILDWSQREEVELQRDHFHRLDAGCRLGRFDRLLWRRSRTPRAFCSTWNPSEMRARSCLPLAKSRSPSRSS